MQNPDCSCKENTVEKCDIFDFMAQYVGISVLHPGGFASTKKLIENCKIQESHKVLDIACGKGTTSIMIAKKYGCKVTGIDISPGLIDEAKFLARRSQVNHHIDFEVADATSLPFSDNEYDVAIAQAMLVLIDNKESAIKEALRVLKPSGMAGWIELTWKRQPTEEFMKQVSEVICAYCMLNVRLMKDWEHLFISGGAQRVESNIYSMNFGGLFGMIKDEGITNFVRILSNYMFDSRVRMRMNTLNNFIKNHEDIFGYGIYTIKKDTV